MPIEEPTDEILQARQRLAALPKQTRLRLHRLVRGASEIPLSDEEVESLTELLWAMRGEGIIESLERGYKLFKQPTESPSEIELPEPQVIKRVRKARPVLAMEPEERKALLASLMADRHVPTDAPSRQKKAK